MNFENKLKVVLDSLYDGILIIDEKGIVQYINPSYTRITKIKEEEILNKKLTDVRKDSHLTRVMKSGIQELGLYRTIGNIKYIVNMVPIIENKKIIGGISVVNEMQDIQNTLDKTLLLLDNLKQKVKTLNKNKYTFDSIISIDKNSIDTKNYAKKISKSESNVLIFGESGTGKELYAHAIHSESLRKNSTFIALNCATLDKNLIESELFGYEEGAFTDAKKFGKIGLFQMADGGTLFLDEIAELDYSLQNKLLRVLQEKTIRKIGGTEEITVDFRLICATNQNLLELVNSGKFRKDLYYRIAVIPLNLLPLKERRKDILPLAEKFISDLCQKYKKEVKISDEVKHILYSHNWNGNVRELRNVMEFAFSTVDGNILLAKDIPFQISKNLEILDIENLSEYIKKIEKEYILNALSKYDNNITGKKEAAKKLGISLATLYNKLS